MPAGLIELTPELAGRCREEQGEVGSTLGIKDLGVGWSNVKSSGASPIGAPTYWWVGIPPGVTGASRFPTPGRPSTRPNSLRLRSASHAKVAGSRSSHKKPPADRVPDTLQRDPTR